MLGKAVEVPRDYLLAAYHSNRFVPDTTGLERVSLQEALKCHLPDFASRSRERQRRITINAEERRLQEVSVADSDWSVRNVWAWLTSVILLHRIPSMNVNEPNNVNPSFWKSKLGM